MISINPNWFRKPKENQTETGKEIPDPTPIAPPVGYKKQASLSDQMREAVRDYKLMQKLAADDDVETFEEADDFDVGDDFDPNTPYEETFDPSGRSSFTPLSQVTAEEQAANEAAKARIPTPQPPAATPPTEPGTGDNNPPAKQGV